jgi:hypothetical protein
MSDDTDMPEIAPPWKGAFLWIEETAPEPGTVLRHEQLYARMGITMPTANTAYHVGERAKLAYFAQLDLLRRELLDELQIDLRSVQGVGYEIVPPSEQTAQAWTDAVREVRRALAKGARRITNVKVDALTDEQRKENSDAIAKLSMLRGLVSQHRRLKP